MEVFEQRITCADGVDLSCRIWLPDGKGPWPVLFMRQPYGRAIASTVTYAHPSWYASHGFAVLVQDVRGRGDSAGDFQGFRQEAPDGSATLAWLRQQSWCDGQVGSYGFSYQGLSQLLLSEGDALPDALAPAMAGLDERLHWASEGGCHWWAIGVGWALQLAAQGLKRRDDLEGWQTIRAALESGRFLNEGLSLLERFDPQGMGLRWLRQDPSTSDGWTCHTPPAELWQRPMLLVGGWHDPHLRGVLDLWQRSRAAGTEPLLRIGAWSHLNWGGGIDALQLSFFKEHLCGNSADPAEPRTLMQEIQSGHWRERSPDQCSHQSWGLTSAGLAAIRSDEGELNPLSGGPQSGGQVVVVHDPWRPLPGRGGHLGLDAGVVGRGDLDQRSDVACFSTAPFQETSELLGEPVLELHAAADQPGFDLCLALSIVTPDGQVRQLSTGVARYRGEDCQRMERRQVALQPLLTDLPAGCRLRLSIGLAAWPQIAVNPGDGSLPEGSAGARHRVISVTLQLADSCFSIRPMAGAN